MKQSTLKVAGAVGLVCVGWGLHGCGGGAGDEAIPLSRRAAGGLTIVQREQAAKQTAQNNSACTPIQPFYWEIGDRNIALTSGTASQTKATSPVASTQMSIGSASQWMFGAYVAQVRNGNLTADDISALTMRTPYTNLSYDTCSKSNRVNRDAQTVHGCFTAPKTAGNNNDRNADPNQAGKFFYNGGHFQSLADGALSLGADNNAALKTAVAFQFGRDFAFSFNSPQVAAGIQTSGQDYGFFLRKILSKQLSMYDLLGAHAVCTNPSSCAQAVYTPIPSNEQWHYSVTHWVEDDPNVGDGAFSSPGAFGFYPWIDAGKIYYGVLARYAAVSYSGNDPVAMQSVSCGRLIRKAWATGVVQ